MSTDSFAIDSEDADTPRVRLVSTLRTIDYPAAHDDLLRIAVSDHLDVATITAFRALPQREYDGVADVLRTMDAAPVDASARNPEHGSDRAVGLLSAQGRTRS